MRFSSRSHATRGSVMLAGALWCGACQPNNGAVVLTVTNLPAGTQKLHVSAFLDGQSISERTFDSGIAGQSSVQLGYRVPEDKLGRGLNFFVEAHDAQCPLADGRTAYTVSVAERAEQSVALTPFEAFGPSTMGGAAQTLSAVHGSSASNVFASATDGRLVRGTGSCWAIVPDNDPNKPNPVPALNAVHVAGSDEVWAAGDAASIVHYSQKVLTRIPSLIQGKPTIGKYNGVWQAGPNDVWFVGANASTNSTACLLHHFDGTKLEDFSQLCTTLGTPSIVELVSIWGVTGPGGTTLYATGERNLTGAGNGNWQLALIVKNGAASWQSVALNSTIAMKAEKPYSLWGLSKDEVVIGVNYGNVIHYKKTGDVTGSELTIDAARSPGLDDIVQAISGDSQSNLYVLYVGGTGQNIYRTHGALTPWSNVTSSLNGLNPNDVRALYAADSTGAFLVGRTAIATKKALP